MLYITDIQTNIKFPGSVCLSELTPHIFLSGPNGSGKTALLNAVELALIGEVRDVGGRDRAKSSTLLADLLHPSEETLFAVVSLNDGRKATWVMERGKRPVHTPLDGNVHFLMPEVMNALKGSKAVTARFLIKYFGADVGFDEINYGAFADLQIGTSKRRATFAPHERLLAIEEASRKAATAHTTEARALKVALEKLGGTSEKFAEHSEKVVIANAIKQLLTFQVANDLDTCGVCGTPDIPLTLLGGRLAQVQQLLNSLGGGDTSDKIRILQTAYEEASTQAASCKAISTNCMEAMYKLVAKLTPRILLNISECLPLDYEEAGLRISKSTIAIGLQDKDTEFMRTHISGAEFVTLCAAIGAAIAKLLPVRDLAVLTLPDRALDLSHLKGLLVSLKAIPAVTIIQSPFQPRGRPAAGWTRILLDNDGTLAVHGAAVKGISSGTGCIYLNT
jgi:energy-coupling factor transporter ATP-binding protein EcfA2